MAAADAVDDLAEALAVGSLDEVDRAMFNKTIELLRESPWLVSGGVAHRQGAGARARHHRALPNHCFEVR